MKKINTTNSFLKKLDKLEKKHIYSLSSFTDDMKLFLANESNPKFRKHKLHGYKRDIFSIRLGYDLRALYFFINTKENHEVEYLFFDIGDHDSVY